MTPPEPRPHHQHPFTDSWGRNLCDRCDKWQGAPAHATPAAETFEETALRLHHEETGRVWCPICAEARAALDRTPVR